MDSSERRRQLRVLDQEYERANRLCHELIVSKARLDIDRRLALVANQKKAVRCRQSPLRPIHTLPDDVLAQIFEDLYRHDSQQCILDPSSHLCGTLNSPQTIMKVSRRFRALALSLPCLWQCVHLVALPSTFVWRSEVEACLANSQNLPLYIIVSIPDLYQYELDPGVQFELECEDYNEDEDDNGRNGDNDNCSMEHQTSTWQCIVECWGWICRSTERWKYLSIVTGPSTRKIFEERSIIAVNLEHFHATGPNLKLFAPRLLSLSTEYPVSFLDSKQDLSRLTTLTWHASDATQAYYRGILVKMSHLLPSLKTLTLDWPRCLFDPWLHYSYQDLLFPNVTQLAIKNVDVCNLLDILPLPMVHTVYFERCLSPQGAPNYWRNATGAFSNVKRITLARKRGFSSHLGQGLDVLFAGTTAVEYLALVDPDPDLLPILVTDNAVFPQLKMLVLVAACSGTLFQSEGLPPSLLTFAQVRADAGTPLEKIRICTHDPDWREARNSQLLLDFLEELRIHVAEVNVWYVNDIPHSDFVDLVRHPIMGSLHYAMPIE